MAKYNIYGHVLYSEIEYEKLMYMTEKIFIQSLMNRIPNITEWTNSIWDNIDHEYMIKTLEEIKRDIINTDVATLLKYQNTTIDLEKIVDITENIKDIFEITPIERFKEIERVYATRVEKAYKQRIKTIDDVDETQYLTEQIKNFNKIENIIPYKHGNETIRHVPVSTYLSMLYNVNLTRTGWNQTFKDANYFEKDTVVLVPHPLSCPRCLPFQGKLFSLSGKKGQRDIKEAYEGGVGHPNCKCEFDIVWSKEQLQMEYPVDTTEEDYKMDQKRKATERELRRAENDLNLYQMIGNGEMVDKTLMKVERLKEKL